MNIALDFVVFNHSYETNPFEMETIFDITEKKKIERERERERMDCGEWDLNGMEGGREDKRNKKGSERIWAVACGTKYKMSTSRFFHIFTTHLFF